MPGQLVLDRILDRDDVRVLGLQGRQRRAQRRRLAAAGGADDEDHPVLVTQEEPQLFERGGREPELFERRHALAVIEDAKHHLLAEERAQCGHAEVDFGAFVRGYANASVLREALFRDVHAGHDLQPRDQTLVDPLRKVHHLFQEAVEPMSHEHALFQGLDVHVAGVAADGAAHHEIDEIDNRRCFAALLESRDRLEHLVFAGPPGQRRLGRAITGSALAAGRLNEPARGRRLRECLVGIALLNRVENLRRRRHNLLDAVAGLELEVLHQAEQQRIGHGHRQQVLLEARGDADTLDRNVLRE